MMYLSPTKDLFLNFKLHEVSVYDYNLHQIKKKKKSSPVSMQGFITEESIGYNRQ